MAPLLAICWKSEEEVLGWEMGWKDTAVAEVELVKS